MTCAERQDQILLYAADALGAVERDALRSHLASGCPVCAAALAEAQEAVGHLPFALPPMDLPVGARDRLMRRVLTSHSTARRVPSRFGPRAVFALLSTVAATVAIVVAIQFQRDAADYRSRLVVAQLRLRDVLARSENQDIDNAALRQAIAEASQVNNLLRAKNLKLVTIVNAGPQPDAWGRVVWDRDQNRWHVSVFNLKSLPPDKVYQLWYLTPKGEALPGPTFKVDAGGNADVALSVPGDIGPVDGAGITIEKIGGASTPTLPVQLAGKLEK